MKIAILGFGKEGQSTYRFLKSRPPPYKKLEIWVLDKNTKIKLPKKIRGQLGKNYLKNLNRFDLVFRSPGIPYHIVAKRLQNLKLTSATRLFMELCPCPIIGITGTKGKGTTATLLHKILKAWGKNTYLAGNIGKPALDILPKLKRGSLVVLELSSFQLEDLKTSPHTAVVLDVFPDHLDAHPNLKDYLNAKSSITKFQTSNDTAFYFSDNKYSKQTAKKGSGKKISIYHAISQTDRKKLKGAVRIPGPHNWRNAQAAFAIARHFGCPKNKILKTIAKFKGNEHRLEFVKTIDGISFYNDSASTNPQTTLAAIRSFAAPKIIIAGGSDKGLDYKIWAKEFKRHKVKAVVLIGANKNKVKRELRIMNYELEVTTASNLKSAINAAFNTVKRSVIRDSKFIIIFSPGAASFDMFKNYADRGEKFKRIVLKLA